MDALAYFRFLAALLFVLALIGLIAWGARRFRPGGGAPAGAQRRLQVIEILPLDPRRRLVLVRHDTAEHLLLIGDAANRLIETRRSGDATAAAPRSVRPAARVAPAGGAAP